MNLENDVFFTRRSVRNYTNQIIEQEKMDYILRAAMYAPSANNKRSWQMIVVDDKKLFEQINNVHPYASMILEASHAIVVCGDLSIDIAGRRWMQDCAAATQNILLSAAFVGVGSCWLGVAPEEDRMQGIVDIFTIPDHVKPFSIVTLGYPKTEMKVATGRYEEEKLHYNKY